MKITSVADLTARQIAYSPEIDKTQRVIPIQIPDEIGNIMAATHAQGETTPTPYNTTVNQGSSDPEINNPIINQGETTPEIINRVINQGETAPEIRNYSVHQGDTTIQPYDFTPIQSEYGIIQDNTSIESTNIQATLGAAPLDPITKQGNTTPSILTNNIQQGKITPVITNPNIQQGTTDPTITNPDIVQGSTTPLSSNPIINQGSVTPTIINPNIVQGSTTPTTSNPIINQGSTTPTISNPNIKQGSTDPRITNPIINQGSVTPQISNPVINQGSTTPQMSNPTINQGSTTPSIVTPNIQQGSTDPVITNPNIQQGSVTPAVIVPNINQGSTTPTPSNPIINQGSTTPETTNPNIVQGSVTPTTTNPVINQGSTTPSIITPNINQGSTTPAVLTPNINQGSTTPSILTPNINQGSTTPAVLVPVINQGSTTPSVLTPNINQGSITPSVITPNINQGSTTPTPSNPNINQGSTTPTPSNPNIRQGSTTPVVTNPNINQGNTTPVIPNPNIVQGSVTPRLSNPNIVQGSSTPRLSNPNINQGSTTPIVLNPNINQGSTTVSTSGWQDPSRGTRPSEDYARNQLRISSMAYTSVLSSIQAAQAVDIPLFTTPIIGETISSLAGVNIPIIGGTSIGPAISGVMSSIGLGDAASVGLYLASLPLTLYKRADGLITIANIGATVAYNQWKTHQNKQFDTAPGGSINNSFDLISIGRSLLGLDNNVSTAEHFKTTPEDFVPYEREDVFVGGIGTNGSDPLVPDQMNSLFGYPVLTYQQIAARAAISQGQMGVGLPDSFDSEIPNIPKATDDIDYKKVSSKYSWYTDFDKKDKSLTAPISNDNPQIVDPMMKYDSYLDNPSEVTDYVALLFKDLRTEKTYQFRSYIQNISDRFNPLWQDIQYIGRPSPLKLFVNVSRDISLDFIVPALDRGEMRMMYKKLEQLAKLTMPTGVGIMQAPMMRFTLGDWFVDEVAHINSLSFTIEDNYTWEINVEGNFMEMPHVIKVSMGIYIIGENAIETNKYNVFGVNATGKDKTTSDTANFSPDKLPADPEILASTSMPDPLNQVTGLQSLAGSDQYGSNFSSDMFNF